MNTLKNLVFRGRNKIFVLILMLIFGAVVHKYEDYDDDAGPIRSCEEAHSHKTHKYVVENYYRKRRDWKTSNLGSVRFKNVDSSIFLYTTRETKKFIVLLWRFHEPFGGNKVENPDTKKANPLEGCSVQNCVFERNDTYLQSADAILVNMQNGYSPHIKREGENLKQRWIFLSAEPPVNTFPKCPKPTLKGCSDIFNWTMTYRSDSDIPIPYGRTVPLPVPVFDTLNYDNDELTTLIPYWKWKRHDVLVAIYMSSCTGLFRAGFLDQLNKHINVDVYGKCSQTSKRHGCHGRSGVDCEPLNKYLFYLAFEDSRCRQYLTDKLFYNAYSKGAIPVIIGAPREDCEKLLPPDSFIHVDNFKTPKDLAQHILRVNDNYNVLMSYHKWRNHFKVVNEHSVFRDRPLYRGVAELEEIDENEEDFYPVVGQYVPTESVSLYFCRLCEALNYNDGGVSVYDEDDLMLFFDGNLTCKHDKFIP